MIMNNKKLITATELEIMNLLWDLGTPLTAAEIVENSKDKAWKPTGNIAVAAANIRMQSPVLSVMRCMILKRHLQTTSFTAVIKSPPISILGRS